MNVPKKGAGRRLAEKLKQLGEQAPPQDLVDKINGLKEIRIRQVYTNGGCFYRPIGWLGQNSVVFEQVTVHQTNRGFHFYYMVRRMRGNRVYTETLNKFSQNYRLPTPEDLRNGAKD